MKKEIIIGSIGLFGGLGIGYYLKPTPKTITKTVVETKVETIRDNSHDSIASNIDRIGNTSVTRTFYRLDGSLESRENFTFNGTTSIRDKREVTKTSERDIAARKEEQTVVKSSSRSPWAFGVLTPISDIKNPNVMDTELFLSYDIFTNVSIIGQTDIKFVRPMVGISFRL